MTGGSGTEELPVQENELISIYPRLYHMAEDGSFPSIRNHGLMSASALLDAYGISGDQRLAIEERLRPESVDIAKDGLPNAVIRDNKPMSDSALQKCLQDGLTPFQWYKILNSKTFFWLHKKRLHRLLAAKAYRDRPHTILTFDTASLVAAHRDSILLSPINSGSTIMNPQPRGKGTFVKIADYPFAERRKTRPLENALVELTVAYSVPDAASHLLAAQRVNGDEIEDLWRRPGSHPHEGV
ncbi:hypothetical protein NKJ35_21605 [Mesorhizobium sp. M0136]|uniref:DUF7002 family protein n=1 Tax=Mesorhizobium sp. M0136 TaxID=2956890 RepID=UPI0033374C6A